MEKKKNYSVAPLPFQGQKRNFVVEFRKALEKLKEKQDVKIIVDLFGGSGLLSRVSKDVFPKAKVIYNDYDDFNSRLQNVYRTNVLINDLRLILKGYPRALKLTSELKEKVLQCIKKEEVNGFVDYITISSCLLFSSKYAINYKSLEKETFYNKVRMSDYDFDPGEYLDQIEVVRTDYANLFAQYKNMESVLFLIDPPYLSTDTTTYHSDKYWRLKNYLDVLHTLRTDNYFFFTSEKSQLVELCGWFSENYNMVNPFHGSILKTHTNSLNKDAKYTDMMLYKYKNIEP